MKEIWKKLPTFNNHLISTHGRLKNITTNKILLGTKDEKGYMRYNLTYNKKQRRGKIHRLMLLAFPCYFIYMKGTQIDHIDGNKGNNKITNLRLCTNQENQWNSRSYKGKSKYKGVSYRKDNNKWRAIIYYNKKPINLGQYNTEKEAAEAYNKKAKILYKEYSNLNKI